MIRHLVMAVAVAALPLTADAAAQGRGRGASHPQQPRSVHAPQGPKPTARGPASKPTTATPKGQAAGKVTPARATPRTTPRPDASAPIASTGVVAPATLPKNPQLVARLQALLPAGTDIQTAAIGFRNQGQFVAAVHASRNLGIPFTDLKTRMVIDQLALGQAIHALRPNVDADREAARAIRQASLDLNQKRAPQRPQRAQRK